MGPEEKAGMPYPTIKPPYLPPPYYGGTFKVALKLIEMGLELLRISGEQENPQGDG
jgi:hypothetical protein